MNLITEQISKTDVRAQELSAAITACGTVWRDGALTDPAHVRSAIRAIYSDVFGTRFLDAIASDVVCLALGHASTCPHVTEAGRAASEYRLTDAVWKFVVSRQHLYKQLVESVTGRYLTRA